MAQDLCPEHVAILPKKLQFADSNAQSMDYLNALLQKQETHDIEEIDFDRGVTVGYDGVEKDLLKAQEVVIQNIAIRCPNLQYLWRFFLVNLFSPFLFCTWRRFEELSFIIIICIPRQTDCPQPKVTV
jgi:hypothetical protein